MEVYVTMQVMFMEKIGRKGFVKMPIHRRFPIGEDLWQLDWAMDQRAFRVSHLKGYQRKISIDGGELRLVDHALQDINVECKIVAELMKAAKRERKDAHDNGFTTDAADLKIKELKIRGEAAHLKRVELETRHADLSNFMMEVRNELIDPSYLYEEANRGVLVPVLEKDPDVAVEPDLSIEPQVPIA